jgi:sugar phosphate permease
MGFAYLGIGIGGALVPKLAFWLYEYFGGTTNGEAWHLALRTIGIMIVVIALPMAFFVRDSPAGRSYEKAQRQSPVPIRPILRSPYFYILAIGSMCSVAAVGGTYQNLKLFLSLDQNFSQAQIADFLPWVLGASIFGRLFMGWLADHLWKKYVMILIYLLVATAIPLLFLAHSTTALYAFAIIFGIGLGGDYMIIPLMAAEIFGVRVLGRVMGIILTADGVAEAAGPWFVGLLRDRTGSYSTGFTLLIALALLGAIAVTMLPRRGAGDERDKITE